MLKKDFLLFLHADWKHNVSKLHEELNDIGGNKAAQLDRIRKADQWIAIYAAQLRDLYGIEA
jgi:hypothetical protein